MIDKLHLPVEVERALERIENGESHKSPGPSTPNRSASKKASAQFCQRFRSITQDAFIRCPEELASALRDAVIALTVLSVEPRKVLWEVCKQLNVAIKRTEAMFGTLPPRDPTSLSAGEALDAEFGSEENSPSPTPAARRSRSPSAEDARSTRARYSSPSRPRPSINASRPTTPGQSSAPRRRRSTVSSRQKVDPISSPPFQPHLTSPPDEQHCSSPLMTWNNTSPVPPLMSSLSVCDDGPVPGARAVIAEPESYIPTPPHTADARQPQNGVTTSPATARSSPAIAVRSSGRVASGSTPAERSFQTISTPISTPTHQSPTSARLSKLSRTNQTHIQTPSPYQKRMDHLDVPYHWQWYIALHVQYRCFDWSNITWDDWDALDIDSHYLPKTSVSEPAVRPSSKHSLYEWVQHIGRSTNPNFIPLALPARWTEIEKELRREESSLRADDNKRLGCEEADGWYGGKISFSISLEFPRSGSSSRAHSTASSRTNSIETPASSNPNPFLATAASSDPILTLRPVEHKSESSRYLRLYGSRRFIHCSIPEYAPKARVFDFFTGRVFVLLGRSFVMFFAKSPTRVTLIETGEIHTSRGPRMPGLLEVINRHNPLSENHDQPMSKWATRFTLGFSDTIPSAKIPPECCEVEDDVIAQSWITRGVSSKPPAEVTLTDGHGYMSAKVARQVFIQAGLSEDDRARPSCLQMRFAGCKGMLSLMPANVQASKPDIDLLFRSSQEKIKWPAPSRSDPSLRLLELVRPPRLKSSTSLSAEVMIIMDHGGVRKDVFADILRQTLKSIQDDFDLHPRTDPQKGIYEGPDDVLGRLLYACHLHGGVNIDKAKRVVQARGVSVRGRGVSLYRVDRAEDERSGLSDASGEGLETSEDFAAEAAVKLLMAGFNPLSCRQLRSKISAVAQTSIDSASRLFRLPVARSLEGFVITDDRLKADEIVVNMTNALVDPETKEAFTSLSGDCLVTRHPCKLLTDVRKFRAVYHPELSGIKDCIIMSSNPFECQRSPASYLGGGDYDGDTVQVFWEPAIADQFTNAADEGCVDAPADLEEQYFEKTVERGTDFLERLLALNDKETTIAEYQRVMAAELRAQPLVGIYTGYHHSAVYMHGPGSPQAIRLAHVLCLCLDASKSGLRLRQEKLLADKAQYNGHVHWLQHRKAVDSEEARQVPDDNRRDIQRKVKGAKFIMDHLIEVVKECKGAKLEEGLREDYGALIAPWQGYYEDAKARQDDELLSQMNSLREKVRLLFLEWQGSLASQRGPDWTPSKNRRNPSPVTQKLRVLRLRYVAIEATSYSRLQLDLQVFARLKASCAVHVEDALCRGQANKMKLNFAFGVALDEVCCIKAGQGGVIMTSMFWDCFKPNSKLLG